MFGELDQRRYDVEFSQRLQARSVVSKIRGVCTIMTAVRCSSSAKSRNAENELLAEVTSFRIVLLHFECIQRIEGNHNVANADLVGDRSRVLISPL